MNHDAHEKLFPKSAPFDITGGRVHLDLCWIDEQRYFSPLGRLVDDPGQTFETACKANQTHTLWSEALHPIRHTRQLLGAPGHY